MKMLRIYFLTLVLVVPSVRAAANKAAESLGALKPGDVIQGFEVDRMYLDSSDRPFGVRVIHNPSHAPVAVFFRKGVQPQAHFSVEAPAGGDEGLPHALEHLLAGKGTRGRKWSLLTQMRLSPDGAATNFDFTFYHFQSPLGLSAFGEELETLFQALFKPDFSDDEASYEFYHLVAEKNPQTGHWTFAEKGTVYAEMASQPGYWAYWRALRKWTLGDHHPWGDALGGEPDSMRGVTPAMIRDFHRKHYRLGPSTTLIVFVPDTTDLSSLLRQLRDIYEPFVPEPPREPWRPNRRLTLYSVESQKSQQVEIFPFPAKSTDDPSSVTMGWNPVETHSTADMYRLGSLMTALAQDASSPLYLALVGEKTRKLETGATEVSSGLQIKHSAIWPLPDISVEGIPGKRVDRGVLKSIASTVAKTISEIADYPDHSEQLAAFNQGVLAEAENEDRKTDLWLESQPRFGFDEAQGHWKEWLDYLDLQESFRVHVSPHAEFLSLRTELKAGTNIWKDIIARFHLTRPPHIAAGVPSPELMRHRELEQKQRIDRAIEAEMAKRGVSDPDEALRLRSAEEKQIEKKQAELAKQIKNPGFPRNPPKNLDPEIKYERGKLGAGIPYHASFVSPVPLSQMKLRFDYRALPVSLLPYISVFPHLIQQAGLREGSVVTTPSQVSQLVKLGHFDISGDFEQNHAGGWYDWIWYLEGRDLGELQTAVSFLKRIAFSPNWDSENLPRVREVVSQLASHFDSVTQGGKVGWVENPMPAFRFQNDLDFTAGESIFTQAHWVDRILWRLHSPVVGRAYDEWATRARSLKLDREHIQSLSEKGLEGELREYLLKNLPRFPAEVAQQRLKTLVDEMAEDLAYGPGRTLQDLQRMPAILFTQDHMSVEVVTERERWPEIQALAAQASQIFRAKDQRPTRPLVSRQVPRAVTLRVRQHASDFSERFPYFLGFIDEDASSGQAVIQANSIKISEPARAPEFLAQLVFGGTGPHTFWMRTWEAGLAHGNGVSANPVPGRLRYHADRSPNLPALMRLIAETASNVDALDVDSLADYTLSTAYRGLRLCELPGERGAELANDFRFNAGPEVQARFYSQLGRAGADKHRFGLYLREHARRALDPVLIDHSALAIQRKSETIFMLLGSQKTLDSMRAQIPPGERLTILWPSDFWLSWPVD